MPDPTPPRPSLATLLRQPARPAPEQADAVVPADADAATGSAETGDTGGVTTPRADVAPPSTPAPASMPEADAARAAGVAATPPAVAAEPIAPAGLEPQPEPAAASESESERAPPLAHGPELAAAAIAAPSFIQPSAPRRPVLRAAPWQWIALVGLGLLLALQILVADRQRLGADARWRPWVAGVCQALRCSLPPWREPSAFTMLSREVRPLPGRAGTLQIQATFRNDARWAQAWPLLQLSLADADGRTIGSRVLRPEEYLGRTRPDAATLAPGQSAQVAFQVREPAAGTAAFSFDFH
ncbi:DUF3426 domain-containing protein [Xanthomonas tesorieronis]|uniref:DUF3426 domain-containing protein n=1 Tax=Xanthomonas tesorieronis TaxID=3160839 RepID=UPI003519D485